MITISKFCMFNVFAMPTGKTQINNRLDHCMNMMNSLIDGGNGVTNCIFSGAFPLVIEVFLPLCVLISKFCSYVRKFIKSPKVH